MIPFNKPYLTGKEVHYLCQAVANGKLSGNGIFTQKCQKYFELRYGFRKVLLTTSCTDALEMCAILAQICPGDEVIVPSFTFVSTALAFVRQGAKIVFADSGPDHPNMDVTHIESLITPHTKAIVPVHYAGMACDMDSIMELSEKYGLIVIEDAAQAIDSYYKGKPLGSIGHLAAFSFHETKNIISGEGGMVVINDERFVYRAEVIWEKGTNRTDFFRGQVNKYEWVDIGSSFLPSETVAAFLWAQIESFADIQNRRKQIWDYYHCRLSEIPSMKPLLPKIPAYAVNNAHMYYLVCQSLKHCTELLDLFKSRGILAVNHYVPLHSSVFYKEKHDGRTLSNTEHYADCLVRLPFYYELTTMEMDEIIQVVKTWIIGKI